MIGLRVRMTKLNVSTHCVLRRTDAVLHIVDGYTRRIVHGGKDDLSSTQVDHSASFLEAGIISIS